jgi:hypothetical protein
VSAPQPGTIDTGAPTPVPAPPNGDRRPDEEPVEVPT